MNFSFGTNYALPKLSLKSDAGVVTGNVIRGKGNEPPSICTKVGGVFFNSHLPRLCGRVVLPLLAIPHQTR